MSTSGSGRVDESVDGDEPSRSDRTVVAEPAAVVGAHAAVVLDAADTPSLTRRMASFVYEALLLFGVSLVPGIVGAVFTAQTGRGHPLQSDAALRVFAFLVYGLYFVAQWSRSGQTLAMQTWRIRVVTGDGLRLGQGRALLRYLACCACWFGPALVVAAAGHLRPWPTLGLVAAGIALYALSTLLARDRQFWHDRLCATRLVDVPRVSRATKALRPRPR